jgi:hypothetical protein
MYALAKLLLQLLVLLKSCTASCAQAEALPDQYSMRWMLAISL